MLRLLLRASAFAVIVASSVALAQPQGLPRLLGPSVGKAASKSSVGTTPQARLVRPDVKLLEQLARDPFAGSEGARFVLDLFPGLELEAEVVAAETRSTGATVFARLKDVDLGSAVLTWESGVLTAAVDFPLGNFTITRQADGNYEVARMAAQWFPIELKPRTVFGVMPKAATGRAGFPEKDAPVDSGRLIDIMVVWTPAAQSSAGGLANVRSLAQAAVDSANAIYLNSGIANRLRLVHAQQIGYLERTSCGATTFDCALDDLTFVGDGLIDEVHSLRDLHGADLVALLIDDDPQFCGLAWLPDSISAENAWLGFSVTARSCALGNKSFAHELGHNMGAHHDPANSDDAGPKPYNHGYISPQRTWRTVMAYGDPCSFCPRLSFFSNPRLNNVDGDALGTAMQSNNALVLNLTGKAIAGYRSTSALHPLPQRFTDVATNHPFFGDIEFLAQAGITNGCSVAEFCPDSVVTRGQMAAFLERAMRAANWAPPPPSGGFNDVLPGAPFAGYIEQLYVDGITNGCSSTPLQYCPDNPVTRGQMAVLLLNASCGPAYTPSAPPSQTFADVPLNHPFASEIDKLYGLGITRGCATSPLRYCPDAPVTRGQAAALLERSFPFRTPSEVCSP